MPRHSVLLFLGCVGVGALWAAAIAAQSETPRKYRRAQTPDFRRQVPDRVFFDDVLSRTVGERPVGRTAPGEKAGTPALSPENVVQSPPGTAAGWSRVISATTLEDEIKSLKLEIDKVVTTPTAFAGGGHKPARLHFSLLALLFAIVQEYDADVRWKSDAASARSAFARSAANLKAGGSIQVFHEAKRRQQELDELVRGARWTGAASDTSSWEGFVDRTPLMQLLEQRLESNLKMWTASASDFRARVDDMRREAELAAAIGKALAVSGMDDATDAQYQAFARLLEQGGLAAADAARRQDQAAAQQAVSDVSRSCVDCHTDYR